jgi:hypothetical protein
MMEYTEEELLARYKQYCDDFPDYGDGPYKYWAWKEEFLSKRTYSDR